MRKLITIILVLAASVAFGQTTYQLNYDSIRVGKTAGNGATSLYGKTYLKNATEGTPSDSVLTVRNGRVYKIAGSAISSVGFLTYVFSRNASDISGYEQMPALTSYTAGSADTATVAATTTPAIIQEFATNTGFPNTTLIPAGVFNVTYQTQKNSGSQSYYTYAVIYKRNLSGTETAIATTNNSSSVSANTVQSVSVSAVSPTDISVLTTDRIVVKVFAVMVSGTANISIYYDDATDSRLAFPSALVDASNFVPYNGAVKDLVSAFSITGDSIKRVGGTGGQFLMGNGTVQDTTTIQTVANFFPKGDTRWAKGAGNAVLTTGNQTIGGNKTFTDDVNIIGTDGVPSLTVTASGSVSRAISASTSGSSSIAIIADGTSGASGVVASAGNGAYGVQGNNTGSGWGGGFTSVSGPAIAAVSTSGVGGVFQSGSANIAEFYGSGTTLNATVAQSGSISSTPQGTLYGTASGSITSAQLATSLSDETGTGNAVFSASPTFTGTISAAAAGFTGAVNLATSSGNVGIGTTSPDRKLTINSGATGALRIDTDSGVQGFSMSPNSIFGIDESGVGNGRFVINTSGRVGIGTGSPLSKLHISGGGSTAESRFTITNTSQSSTFYYAASNGAAIAYIGSETNHPIAFTTNDTERMRITSGGNVLIGTTTDAGYKLDVNGTARISGTTTLASLSGTGTRMVVSDPSGVLSTQTIPSGGGGGSVTGVAIATANGLSGTSDGASVVPTLTLSTTVNGMVKGNGTSLSAAVAGTDYTTPSSTETFTNKSGNISQWTNDSGYITSSGSVKQLCMQNSTTNSSMIGTVILNQCSSSSLSANGNVINFVYGGEYAVNGNNKSLSLEIGSTTVFSNSSNANGIAWQLSGTIIRQSSNVYRVIINWTQGSSASVTYYTGTVTDFSPLVISLVAGTATTTGDLLLHLASLTGTLAP